MLRNAFFVPMNSRSRVSHGPSHSSVAFFRGFPLGEIAHFNGMQWDLINHILGFFRMCLKMGYTLYNGITQSPHGHFNKKGCDQLGEMIHAGCHLGSPK